MNGAQMVTPPRVDRPREKIISNVRAENDRRAVLVVNTHSRRGARAFPEARRLLAQSGLRLEAAYALPSHERVRDVVQQLVDNGRKFIIIGGGDGTISSIADHFAYANVVFGLLPLGAANSFARALGIPLQLADAVDVVARGKVAAIDLGQINGSCFVSGASVGLAALVGPATPAWMKKWFGYLAYPLVAATQFARYAPFRCKVVIDARERVFDALDVRIANGGFQGGVMAVPGADPGDGKIVVQIVKGRSRWGLIRHWMLVTLRRAGADVDIEILRTSSEAIVETLPQWPVTVDGEVITRTPIHVSVAPEALLLMAPAD